MLPRDVFRSGAGMDERNECGSVILADIYPRRDRRDPGFTHYEGLFDESHGLFGISASGGRGDLFDAKLDETRSSFGAPCIVSRDMDGEGSKMAMWRTDGGLVILEERTDAEGNVVTEMNHSSPVFPEIWDARNERKKA